MSVDNRTNSNFGDQGKQGPGSSAPFFGDSRSAASFSEAVGIAKSERLNGGLSHDDTKYSDGFYDFTRPSNSVEHEEPYFLPITEGKSFFTEEESPHSDEFVTGFDVMGIDDDNDLEEEISEAGRSNVFEEISETDPYFDDFAGDPDPEQPFLYGTDGQDGDENDYGVFFDDDTESEIDFDSPSYEPDEEKKTEEPEEGFGEDEFFEKEFGGRGKNRKIVLVICAAAVIVILLAVLAIQFTISSIIGKGTVYEGVFLNGYSLAGMTQEEVAAYVRKNYIDPIGDASITVRLGDVSNVYALTNFVRCPDADQIAAEAFSVARTGKTLSRVREILALKRSPKNIMLEYVIVDDKLDEVMASATDISFSEPVNPTYEIKNDVVVFTSGRNGTNIDVAKFRWDVSSSLNAFKEAIASSEKEVEVPNIEIEIDTQIVEFVILKAQDIYNAAHVDSEEAYFYRTDSGEIAIREHVRERNLDIEELNAMVRRINSGESIPYAELSYVYTDPSVTTDFLRARLFTDTLNQTMSVNKADLFSKTDWVGIEERSVNLRQAAAGFGRVTLLAGETVSFLSSIGTVSSTAGYVNAYENLYSDGKKVMGGGISQVASAVYIAALKSGLEISEHHNNTYYPNFGLVGFDAYVGNGNDLVIKNNREYPVSIEVVYANDTITVTIKGVSSGGQAVMLNVVETSNELVDGGNRLVYDVSMSQGYSKTALGSVTYLRLSDEPILPPDDGTAEPSETPDGTAEPTETPDETPDETAEPTETPDETDEPTETPDGTEEPTGTEDPSNETPGPTETPAPETPAPETEVPARETPAP